MILAPFPGMSIWPNSPPNSPHQFNQKTTKTSTYFPSLFYIRVSQLGFPGTQGFRGDIFRVPRGNKKIKHTSSYDRNLKE
jgi:hypothetical protein